MFNNRVRSYNKYKDDKNRIERFGPNTDFRKIVRWVLIIILAVLAIYLLTDLFTPKEVLKLDINTMENPNIETPVLIINKSYPSF